MAVVFFLLMISSLVLLLVGLVKPDKVFLGPDSPRSKVAGTYGSAAFLFLVAFIIAIPKHENPALAGSDLPTEQPQHTAQVQEKSALDLLIEQKLAFPPGTYAKGTIPKGEFIFIGEKGGYYAEERDGQILDNENFDSFGYVYNHAIGDITTHGLLISPNALKELNASGAKALYERLTKQTDYNFSGQYKVGSDIPAGRYIVESAGEAYVEVNRGPVGNGELLNNDNFNGTKSINLRNGQFVKISRASLTIQNEK
jgi:hypothetical protein